MKSETANKKSGRHNFRGLVVFSELAARRCRTYFITMKSVRFALIGLMATSSLMGEPPRRGEGGPPDGEGSKEGGSFGRFFESADTNGDGVVSSEEFAAIEPLSKLPAEKCGGIFRRFDKDGDGSIQRSEMRPPKQHDSGKRPFPRLHELDSNKDGRVSYDEFVAGPFAKRLPPERLKAFFENLDTNGDGSLSPEDRPKGRGGPRDRRPPLFGREKMIESLDRNGDGVLSFEEFRQAPWLKDKSEGEQEDQFEEIDKNCDLVIDSSDLASGRPNSPRGPRGDGSRGDGPRRGDSQGARGPGKGPRGDGPKPEDMKGPRGPRDGEPGPERGEGNP